jgi:putative tricarboxylic transport membrane protein
MQESESSPDPGPVPPREVRKGLDPDRVGGAVWLLFGGAVAWGSWTMDRLETMGIHPLTAPGLLPGLAGAALMAFGTVLLLRRAPAAEAGPAEDWRRLTASFALCLVFAGVLLGRGPPFWLLAAAFLLVHVLWLEDEDRRAARPLRRRVIAALSIAVGVSAAVTLAFQNLFLIRLP